MVGKSIIADRVCICDPMGPGWSSIDHRRAGPAAIPTGGDLVGCSIDHRRPGQQQESPREGTWLEFDRSSPTGPCLHTSVERVTMSTHIGRESTDRAGRKKVCRVSVLFPLGTIGRNALEGPMVCRLDQSQPPVTMSCDRIAFGHAIALRPGRWKMEVGNGSRQWSPVTMGTSSNAVLRMRPPGDRAATQSSGSGPAWCNHHGNEQQRSPPDEASGRSSSSNPHGRGPGWMFDRSSPTGPAAGIPTGGDLVGVRSSDQRRAMSTHIGRTCDYVYTHRSNV